MKPNPTILAIESSCDETAAAVYNREQGMLANELFSQTELHKQYGGVIPEVASRSHLEKIGSIVDGTLKKSGKTLADIDAIAVTNRPGLPGSLLIGLGYAKGLAFGAQKPIIGINHLEGHAFSACIENDVPFDHICITASGGHSSIYLVKDFGDYMTLGRTTDDAAGEAFDKVAKLLNLGYPGGPIIERYAAAAEFKDYFNYPRGKKDVLDFSFSGLKTAVLYDLVKRDAFDLTTKTLLADQNIELKQQVASSLLVCMADIFVQKVALAQKMYPHVHAVTFVGGVACNAYIRARLKAWCDARNLAFFSPSPRYCTDNAGMIAFVAAYKLEQGHVDGYDLDIGR
jgi:N6-L-threonylcarbamoyladenine synthase